METKKMSQFVESEVEIAAIDYFRGLGYGHVYGPQIAPDEPGAEREDYSQVVLEWRLRQALEELNRDLPAEAIEEAYRKLTRPERPLFIANNHALYRMLVDQVAVQYHQGVLKVSFRKIR